MTSFRFRLIAVGAALILGTELSAYGLSDYQLIKRVDKTDDSPGKSSTLSVYTQPAENVRLKPEAEKKYRDFYARVRQQQEDIEKKKKEDEK